MVTCGHEIIKLNGNSKVLLDLLKAKIETKNDLPTNIFKGYTTCSDKVLIKYVTRNQDGCKEGINILLDNLIHLAVQNFKLLKTTNKQNAPS